MTHLLGRQDCVDSLRRDLIDLQGAVLDVFSRTGPVKCPSWKFPDKLSCNLDLVLLLEKYDFVEGEEEFNQHSHIVLLELVVDRLLLLLQSFSAHIDLILGGKRKCPGTTQTVPSTSIGPAVKNFWNNLVQLGKQYPRQSVLKSNADRAVQSQPHISRDAHPGTLSASRSAATQSPSQNSLSGQFQSTSRLRAAPGSIAASSSQLHQSLPHLFTSCSSSTLSQSAASSPCHTPQRIPATPSISADCHSVGVQTVESSLVPCDACASVQASLRESGVALVNMCETLSLPCTLQRLLVVAEDAALAGRLSASDVDQWAAEQRKDMGRLAKHHQETKAMMDTLREQLKTAEEERGNLKMWMARETEERRRVEEERQKKENERESKQREERRKREEEVKMLQEELEELRRGVVSLEGKNKQLSSELSLQREALCTLEGERDALQKEVNQFQAQEMTWAQVEQRRQDLEAELTNTHLLLDKECAKYQSATRQHESLQLKQRALLERVDSLVCECEELQTCLEDKEELIHTHIHISEERDTLQQQLTNQQAECVELQNERGRLAAQVAELESTIAGLREELKQAAHREKMLVAFPELNPLPQGAPQSTGDVLGDMEQQLQVNSLRIQVLERENATLRNGLDKLRERGRLSAANQPVEMGFQHGSVPDTSKHTQQIYPACTAHSGQGERRHTHLNTEAEERRRAAAAVAAASATDMGPWERPPSLSLCLPSLSSLSSSSSCSSPPSVAVHQQTLQLPLPPQPGEAAQTYTKIRQAARARSTGSRHRRK